MDNPIRPLFDPSVMPVRDAEGYCWHPDLDERWADTEFEEYIDLRKLMDAGFEVRCLTLQEWDDHPARERYSEGDTDIHDWDPEPPEGDGWRLIAVGDTEDGPTAWFLRNAVTA